MSAVSWKTRLLSIGRWVVVLAILLAVGWTFARALAGLQEHQLHWEPGWLVLAGLLYLAGVGFSLLFWWWSLRSLGQRPSFFMAARAYYIGHLGKYVPGKALVIVLRTALVQGQEVKTSVAALAVVYETLTGMAAGALVAAILIAVRLEQEQGRLWQALLLVALAGIPVLPWVFNPLARRLVAPFRKNDPAPLPEFRPRVLLMGVFLGGLSWFVLGMSLWAAVRSVRDYPLGVEEWLTCTAFLCIATVLGFLTPVPGGLGVREGILMVLFSPTLGEGAATVVALLLRLTWIVAELAATGVLYPLPVIWSFLRSRSRPGGTLPTSQEPPTP